MLNKPKQTQTLKGFGQVGKVEARRKSARPVHPAGSYGAVLKPRHRKFFGICLGARGIN